MCSLFVCVSLLLYIYVYTKGARLLMQNSNTVFFHSSRFTWVHSRQKHVTHLTQTHYPRIPRWSRNVSCAVKYPRNFYWSWIPGGAAPLHLRDKGPPVPHASGCMRLLLFVPLYRLRYWSRVWYRRYQASEITAKMEVISWACYRFSYQFTF